MSSLPFIRIVPSRRGRGRLVRQYFFVFLLLIGGGLITSGLLEVYFGYRESRDGEQRRCPERNRTRLSV